MLTWESSNYHSILGQWTSSGLFLIHHLPLHLSYKQGNIHDQSTPTFHLCTFKYPFPCSDIQASMAYPSQKPGIGESKWLSSCMVMVCVIRKQALQVAGSLLCLLVLASRLMPAPCCHSSQARGCGEKDMPPLFSQKCKRALKKNIFHGERTSLNRMVFLPPVFVGVLSETRSCWIAMKRRSFLEDLEKNVNVSSFDESLGWKL